MGVEHHVPTTLGCVVRVSLRPTPLAMKEVLRKEVQSMLSLGIIEGSTSPWRRQLDESLWFCVDFRRLNKITPFDAYPMP